MALGLSLLVFAGHEHPLSAWLVVTWWEGTSLCSLEVPAGNSLMWQVSLGSSTFLLNVSFITERIWNSLPAERCIH